jgi:hypothetical protein
MSLCYSLFLIIIVKADKNIDEHLPNLLINRDRVTLYFLNNMIYLKMNDLCPEKPMIIIDIFKLGKNPYQNGITHLRLITSSA